MKNTVNRIVITSLFVFGCFFAKSQSDSYKSFLIEQQNINFLKSKIGSKRLASYEDVEGNPFLYKDFTTGYIKTNDGKTLQGNLRFNLYTNQLEFFENDNVYILIYDESYIGVKLGEFSIINYKNDDDDNEYYFAYIVGNYNLLAKKSMRFVEEENKLYDIQKPSHFVERKEKFFLLVPNSTFTEIKSIRKLKSSSQEMKNYITEYKENYNLKVEKESLMKFFTWINNK